ncbi:MAG: RloB family protein, partial [Sphingomonadales bacterium]
KRYFYLLSEGEKTEKSYFNTIGSTLDSRRTKIIYKGPLGAPKTVANAAVKFADQKGLSKTRRKKRLNSFEEKDEVWAVFDRDDFTCYGEAKQICDRARFSYAYSDPCFELWINLHFDDYDAPCSRHEAQAITKTLIGEYNPKAGKIADFSLFVDKISEAEKRAERQRANRKYEDKEDGNPSTSVYMLTRSLRKD